MKKYIFIFGIVFSTLLLTGCSSIETSKGLKDAGVLVNTGKIKTDESKIPSNYMPLLTGTISKLLSSTFVANIESSQSISDNCAQPIVAVTKTGYIIKGYCLGTFGTSGHTSEGVGPLYQIATGADNKWFDSNYDSGYIAVSMGHFFEILQHNDSKLINDYIDTLYLKQKYIVYNRSWKLINTMPYRNGVLGMLVKQFDGKDMAIGFKYWLYDGRQYDFSLLAELHDEIGMIPFDWYKDILTAKGCYESETSKCYSTLKELFHDNTTNSILYEPIMDVKKSIDKVLK